MTSYWKHFSSLFFVLLVPSVGVRRQRNQSTEQKVGSFTQDTPRGRLRANQVQAKVLESCLPFGLILTANTCTVCQPTSTLNSHSSSYQLDAVEKGICCACQFVGFVIVYLFNGLKFRLKATTNETHQHLYPKNTVMRVFGRISILALLPLLQVVNAKNEEKMVSIALIPHAVQRRRLLEEHGYAPDELVPDRPHQYQGRRQLQHHGGGSDPTPVSELFQGYGTHYADLWCGTPPQRQTVIVVSEKSHVVDFLFRVFSIFVNSRD